MSCQIIAVGITVEEKEMVVEEAQVVEAAAAMAVAVAMAAVMAAMVVGMAAMVVEMHGDDWASRLGKDGGPRMNRVNAKAPKAKTIGVGQLLESEYCKCVSIQMKPVFGPILLQQPDGSLLQGQPWGHVASPAPSTPSDVEQTQEAIRAFEAVQIAEHAMNTSRKVLICILLASIFVEISLEAGAQTMHLGLSIQKLYPKAALLLNILYGLLYYFLGFQAIYFGRGGMFYRTNSRISQGAHLQRLQRALRRLAFVALMGAMLQPMLSRMAGRSSVLPSEVSES
ncbi:unnamed protein product [Durusdinium trenchii]|uniref:Transmembrane protein 138 n=1 Tax=Durusdinium trenchii TaxID=1381693 RepID=A0ABP0RXQ3_9DINO